MTGRPCSDDVLWKRNWGSSCEAGGPRGWDLSAVYVRERLGREPVNRTWWSGWTGRCEHCGRTTSTPQHYNGHSKWATIKDSCYHECVNDTRRRRLFTLWQRWSDPCETSLIEGNATFSFYAAETNGRTALLIWYLVKTSLNREGRKVMMKNVSFGSNNEDSICFHSKAFPLPKAHKRIPSLVHLNHIFTV